MKLEIKEGKVIIDAFELLAELTGDEKIALVDSLSCQDEVIKHVSDQIVTGWTELSSHGSRGCSETPHTPLDKAIRYIADNSSELAKQEIQRLEGLVKSKQEALLKVWDETRELRDTIQDMRRREE
jgi:hypothetical protein